jgi:hypothetical protein
MKRELHTLYIKYDGQFKTLSKIALSQLILKIIHIKGDGTLLKHIESELATILTSNVAKKDVESAIQELEKNRKINQKNGRFFIHNDYKKQINNEVKSNEELQNKVVERYFSKAESSIEDIRDWFFDFLIIFFEKFSFEWFHQVAYNGKNGSKTKKYNANIEEEIDISLNETKKIKEEDKLFLKQQFQRFIDSDDADDNLLFWYFGISMFSARLITARNYADEMTIDLFKDSRFLLDTNILMILDLEEHELAESLESLELVLKQMNIKPSYFYDTRDEYLRAMDYRMHETVRVFDNFDYNVLKESSCPFVKTALRRNCKNGDDVKRMFNKILDLPDKFNSHVDIDVIDYGELHDIIEHGKEDDRIISKINEIYRRRANRDKRPNPLSHDAGMISGAYHLRKTEKCWIITSDSIIKRYAIENCVRDENEIAIGLDVVLGLMAVNSGGANIDASNFAPLFKNIIKFSLTPEKDSFETSDLNFILQTQIRLNELTNSKLVEIAKEVKKKRLAGEDEESIALYLRRYIEDNSLNVNKENKELESKLSLEKQEKEKVEKERDIAFNKIRTDRKLELKKFYKRKLWLSRSWYVSIPIFLIIIIYFIVNYIDSNYKFMANIFSFLINVIVSLIAFLIKRNEINDRYFKSIKEIDQKVEKEIKELKKQSI